MTTFALTDLVTLVGGFDMSGSSNEAELAISVEELENTTFGQAGAVKGRTRIAGLEDVESNVNGYWESGAGFVDPEVFANLGVTQQAITQYTPNAAGSVAYMYQAREFAYQIGDEIGTVLPYELGIMGAASNGHPGAVRGRVAKARGDVSATGATGAAVNLGPVGAGQFLYATFHVFAAGTTLTVLVESDVDNTFATPATRQTIGPLTAAGGTWMVRVPGPISDPWFRFNISAVAGTFNVAGAIGIK